MPLDLRTRCVWLMLLVLTSSAAVAAEPSPIDKLIHERADGLIAQKRSTGVAVGVQFGDQSYTAFAGRKGLDDEAALDDTTVFEIGSVSKVFTGLLLADAVVRGEVRLDQPVAELLGPDVSVPQFDGRPIRLVDLATHTSGLPRVPTNLKVKNLMNPYADYSLEDLEAFLGKYKLRREPGKTYEYSNVGMGLVGHALAKRAGKSYEELLVERICQPLGMNDTAITLSEDQHSRFAKGVSGVLLMRASPWDIPAMPGAGAIRSTLHDMMVFAHANLQPDESSLADAIRLSHRPRFTISEPSEKSPPKSEVALGWHIRGKGVPIIWHNGMTGGFSSYVALVPEKKLGLVILSNTATFQIDKFADKLLGELLTMAWE